MSTAKRRSILIDFKNSAKTGGTSLNLNFMVHMISCDNALKKVIPLQRQASFTSKLAVGVLQIHWMGVSESSHAYSSEKANPIASE